jgi:site-specific recombinase XerD
VGSFINWLKEHGVNEVSSIKPTDIRAYLVSLQARGLKDTTQHGHARAIKNWLNWLVEEEDLEKSPMRKVKMPRLEGRIPPPYTPEEVQRLLTACDRKTVRGSRDYALVISLLDTGLRAHEIVSLKVGDLATNTGLMVVMGKGRKQREVRVGAKARGAIIRMLGYRSGLLPSMGLWVGYESLTGNETGPLSLEGLRTMLKRLGLTAGVYPCSAHRFRRTFALWCLRDGMDLYSLKLLMGHSSLAVLQRYLALAGEDIERAHKAHSPADRLLGG